MGGGFPSSSSTRLGSEAVGFSPYRLEANLNHDLLDPFAFAVFLCKAYLLKTFISPNTKFKTAKKKEVDFGGRIPDT